MFTDSIKGLLTVIIVTYKQDKYLFETIGSVLIQDYPSIELIVADDGTPEFNINIVRQFIDEKKNENMKYFQILYDGTNVGTVRNINRALAYAKGEYIKLIGGDDLYSDSRVFSNQVDILEHNLSYLAVIGKSRQCDESMNEVKDSRVERSNIALPRVLKMDYDSARRFVYQHDVSPIAIQATCFRNRFFEMNGFCDERYSVIDDSPTVLKLLHNYPNIGYIDDFCVKHRSDVGVSMSRELFAARRIKYYKDCITYSYLEIRPNPHIYGTLNSWEIPRVNEFVFDMANIKKDKKHSIYMLFVICRYFDAILYYSLKNTKKLISRLFKRFFA